jgi:hypothetical protein
VCIVSLVLLEGGRVSRRSPTQHNQQGRLKGFCVNFGQKNFGVEKIVVDFVRGYGRVGLYGNI